MSRTISTRYVDATILTSPGTLRTAPQKTTIVAGNMQLLEAHVTIPAGHTFKTGWAIELAGQIVVPYTGIQPWVFGDDDKFDFDFDAEVGLGLKVVTFNEGQYEHTHYGRMKITDIVVNATPATGAVPIVTL